MNTDVEKECVSRVTDKIGVLMIIEGSFSSVLNKKTYWFLVLITIALRRQF